METSIITNVDELDSIMQQLLKLEQSAELSTQSMSWVRSAAKQYERDRLRIIIVWDGNDIAAAATLAISRIRFVERWVVAGSDFLFEPCGLVYRDKEALAVLIDKLAQVKVPLLLSRISTNQSWVADIDENFNRHVFVAVRPAESCPVIHLHSGWEDPLSQLKSRRRSDLRRAYRRAEQIGQVETIISAPSPEEVDSIFNRAVEVEAASWKGEAGSALLTARPLGDFFRSFVREASLDGSLRISLLRIDGNDAAMQIAVVFRGCWWIYKIGYDEKFARCSPGMILICETIRHAAGNQLESYEFMGATADWLSMWTSEQRQTITMRTYPLSVRGVAAFVIDACSKIATQVRSSFRKLIPK